MIDAALQGRAEDDDDFEPDARGWAARWKMEFEAARKELKSWWRRGERIVKRYLDEREKRAQNDTRWNLFARDVDTLQSLLYGKTPSVDVSRRFQDSQDEIARVAAQILERLLNGDIERDNDKYASALEQALEDHLLPGMGNVRLRYVPHWETRAEVPAITGPDGAEIAPAVPSGDYKTHEDVEVDYVPWKDQMWSPARTFDQIRWWAFKSPMRKAQIKKRFGAQAALKAILNTRKGEAGGTIDSGGDLSTGDVDALKSDPWARADVWEIWDREHVQVFWLIEGMDEILDTEPDPLGLEGFWPFPRPLIAGATTSRFVPRPDFLLTQDIDEELDRVSSRITLLERAIRVVGLYDKNSSPEIERLFTEALQNELIPVANWQVFRTKGGLEGIVDWFPLEQVIKALDVLRSYRQELVAAHDQISGMSDIMRGEAQQTATATEQAIKARFGSVRIQRRQDRFARFASDVQRLRAEIICKHFDAETILKRSNIGNTIDQGRAMEAIQLLQSDYACYRVVVKPENVSLENFAQLKQERSEAATAATAFLEKLIPIGQGMPEVVPELLEVLQWLLGGFRGSSTIEGAIEQMGLKVKQKMAQAQAAAAQAAQNPAQPPPPDPKVLAATVKAQGDIAKTHAATQGRLVEIGAETQAAIAQRTHDARMSVAEGEAKDRRDAMKEVAAVTGPVPGGAA